LDTIASRLKFVRGNLSREKFAELIGIHKNTVGRYERGESEPELTIASKICSEFGIDPRWLLLGEGPQPVISSFRHKTEFDISKGNTRFISIMRDGQEESTNENVELLAQIVLNLIREKEIPLAKNSALAVAYFYYSEMKSRLQHFAHELDRLTGSMSDGLNIDDFNKRHENIPNQTFNNSRITNVAGRDVNNETTKNKE